MKDARLRQVSFVGKRVKKPIYNRYDVMLIPAFSILSRRDIDLLCGQRVQLLACDVEEAKFRALLDEAVQEIKEVFGEARQCGKLGLTGIRDRLVPLIGELTHCANLGQALVYLEQNDDYTFRHSVGVALFSRLIGQSQGMTGKELDELTMAAFLHDIGKVRIPGSILNKTGALSHEEFACIKRHPEYGYELVTRCPDITERQALAVLQHHERMDGSGYPHGLKGGDIHLFGKIVAIADVFHAMISKRPYKSAVPFYQVLQEMNRDAYGKLDPELSIAFMDRLMQTLIGNRVSLSNGGEARIICVKREDPVHPIVESDGFFMDLAKNRDLNMVSIL
ncbi:HD-GYP domain-containing protein [Paenibacillus sp. CAU 1782]